MSPAEAAKAADRLDALLAGVSGSALNTDASGLMLGVCVLRLQVVRELLFMGSEASKYHPGARFDALGALLANGDIIPGMTNP